MKFKSIILENLETQWHENTKNLIRREYQKVHKTVPKSWKKRGWKTK